MIIKVNKELLEKIIKKWEGGKVRKSAIIEKYPAFIGEYIITGFCTASNSIIYQGYETERGEIYTEVNLWGLWVEQAFKKVETYKKSLFFRAMKGVNKCTQ